MITVLKHLKRLGVDLPVEVFHYRDELQDQNQRRAIESFGAVIREVGASRWLQIVLVLTPFPDRRSGQTGQRLESELPRSVSDTAQADTLALLPELADQRPGYCTVGFPRGVIPRLWYVPVLYAFQPCTYPILIADRLRRQHAPSGPNTPIRRTLICRPWSSGILAGPIQGSPP